MQVQSSSQWQKFFEGPNAIAICKEDATAPARVLANFAKTADALELKCGVVEGTYYDATESQLLLTFLQIEDSC